MFGRRQVVIAASMLLAATTASTETHPLAGWQTKRAIVNPSSDGHRNANPVDAGIVREEYEWLDVWIPGNGNKTLPKVLLVGDSIARGYYKDVEDRFKGHAVICRLTTSKSLGDPALLAEVRMVLSQTGFNVVHVNNGLHGWGYSEEQYAAALPELLKAVRAGAPRAKLIWATTTPVRPGNKLDKAESEKIAIKNGRIRSRNAIVAKVMTELAIPVDDLFAVVLDKAEWYSQDGVHFNDKGRSTLAAQVAQSLQPLLDPNR